MRTVLLLLLFGCGEAETVPLDPAAVIPKPPPPTAPIDAGSPLDASSELPRADIVPSAIDFGTIRVGASTDRTILAVNRNDEDTWVIVLSVSDAYRILGEREHEVPAKTRRELIVRFAPRSHGLFDEQFELDACGGGCIARVRLVGSSE